MSTISNTTSENKEIKECSYRFGNTHLIELHPVKKVCKIGTSGYTALKDIHLEVVSARFEQEGKKHILSLAR